MAYKKEHRARRNKLIAEEFSRLFFEEGKREDVIFNELSERYFLSPQTVYRIVLEQQKEVEKIQTKLDLRQ